MDQNLRGNFIAYANPRKQPGDKLPAFHDGSLTIPGTETAFAFALWGHEYVNPKTGEMQVMFNGQSGLIPANAPPIEQITALVTAARGSTALVGNLTLAPRQLVLFPNGFKDAEHPKRVDYWGAFNPGDGQPVVRIGAWARESRYKKPILAGSTSYPIPGKNEPQLQDELDKLLEPAEPTGPAAQPSRKRSKARGDEGRA